MFTRSTTLRPTRVPTSLSCLMLGGTILATGLEAQADCDDVSGEWAVELTLPGSGTNTVTLTLDQVECTVSGVVEGRNRTPFEDGTVEGSTATFTATATNQADGQGIAIVWEATVDGDEIAGSLDSPMMGTIPFSGTRLEGSATQ